jgi:hypothetical protein
MSKLKVSKAEKARYTVYKNEGRALKNKIAKLERHCNSFPEDEVGKANLAKAKKGEYTPRSKPLVPGSNPTDPKVKHFHPQVGHVFGPETAGEQLSKLLGIPVPIVRRRKKPKTVIKHKPRRK